MVKAVLRVVLAYMALLLALFFNQIFSSSLIRT